MIDQLRQNCQLSALASVITCGSVNPISLWLIESSSRPMRCAICLPPILPRNANAAFLAYCWPTVAPLSVPCLNTSQESFSVSGTLGSETNCARGAAHLQADLDFLSAPHCQNIQRRIIDWAVEADISFFNIEFDAEDFIRRPRRARKSPCARKGAPAALLRVIFPTKSRSAPAPRKRKSLPRSIPTRV